MLVSGAVLTWRPVSFGWTGWSSTSPATLETSGPTVIVLDAVNVVAVLGVLVGMSLFAGAVGFHLARSRRATTDT